MDLISNQSVENALTSLTKLLKNACYYPDGHPSLNVAIEQAMQRFSTVLAATTEPFMLTITRQGFFLDQIPIDTKNQLVTTLAQKLFYHKIKVLTFLPQLRDRHLLAFVRLIGQEPSAIMSQGGITALLDQQNISTIAVNELNLSSAIKRQQDLDNGVHNTTTTNGNPQSAPWLNTSNVGIDRAAQQISINKLLQHLDAIMRQPTPEQEKPFLQGLQQLTQIVQRYTNSNDAAQVELILKQIDIWIQNSSLPPRYVKVVKQAVHSLSNEELINLLIDQAVVPAQQTLARHLIPLMNTMTSSILTERLNTEPNTKLRKVISQILVNMGAKAFPALIKSLSNERWFVVRNAVTILAESRDKSLIPDFVKQLDHPDTRVSNETIRALARIKVPLASKALIDHLESGHSDLPNQIILALGALADPMAVAPLMRIATQNDIQLAKKGRTKVAIMALGEIGAADSTDTLIHLLQRIKIIKHKEYNEIRCQAATALGHFNDKKSLKALQLASKSSQRTLAIAARQALRQRGEL